MTNPYESPKTPSEPNEPPRITGAAVGSFLGGAFLCAGLTFVVAFIAAMVAGALISDPYGISGFVVLLNSPAVIAPIFGAILWALVRKRNRPFAIGAIACGVAAFLIVGGCFTLMFLG